MATKKNINSKGAKAPSDHMREAVLDDVDAMSNESVREALREMRRIDLTQRENEYFFTESQRIVAIGSYFINFATDVWRTSEVLDGILGIDVGYDRTIEGWLSLVHWGDREMMERHLYDDAIGQRKPFNKEYRIVRKSDGEVRWVKGLGSVAFDHEGSPLTMVGTIQDITEQRRAADLLHVLARVVEQSPGSIIITDRSGNIEYVNPRFEKTTGYTMAELRGQNTRVLKSGVTPPEVYTDLWNVISKGGEWRGELCNRKKNGKLFWEYATISGLKDDRGDVVHYIAVKEDITARKQVEAENIKLHERLRRSQS